MKLAILFSAVMGVCSAATITLPTVSFSGTAMSVLGTTEFNDGSSSAGLTAGIDLQGTNGFLFSFMREGDRGDIINDRFSAFHCSAGTFCPASLSHDALGGVTVGLGAFSLSPQQLAIFDFNSGNEYIVPLRTFALPVTTTTEIIDRGDSITTLVTTTAVFTAIPEPSTWMLSGIGLLGLIACASRRKQLH